MKEHIIIENAKRYIPTANIETPEGCFYNPKKGFWVEKETNTPMMCGDNPRKPTSKKCDIETGEDQKGE